MFGPLLLRSGRDELLVYGGQGVLKGLDARLQLLVLLLLLG